MITIHADELRPGDVVDYHGQPHRVSDVVRHEGWAWPVAVGGDGWAMALGDDVVVLHRAA